MHCLHAPWRIEYIRAPKPTEGSESLFSRIAREEDDLARYVIRRDETCFALLNTFPYTGGHLLVVPYREVPGLEGLDDAELLGLMKLTRRCQAALSELMRPDGFNIGINLGRVAGAGIAEHVHIHVVPRWSGDTNFMPVTAGTSVLPEALSDIAGALRRILAT